MATFHGPSFKGAKRTVRQLKRNQAEIRNAATPPERRRSARQAKAS